MKFRPDQSAPWLVKDGGAEGLLLTKIIIDAIVTWQAATLAGDMVALFILSRTLTVLVTVLPICAWQTS